MFGGLPCLVSAVASLITNIMVAYSECCYVVASSFHIAYLNMMLLIIEASYKASLACIEEAHCDMLWIAVPNVRRPGPLHQGTPTEGHL